MSSWFLHLTYIAWLMSALATYGCMLIANQVKLEPARVPQVLRAGWMFGCLSLVCLLTGSSIVVFTNLSAFPLADPSVSDVMEWSKNITRGLNGVEQFAVIGFLPTGICWFRERSLRAQELRGDILN